MQNSKLEALKRKWKRCAKTIPYNNQGTNIENATKIGTLENITVMKELIEIRRLAEKLLQ